ncbi:SdiA-regulated domain-containing protein [Stutzerimonas stutzeri]|uniref:SdiA-regulated domain-containing protein n=1 Tax=Stutzerimonas stutzeri TaxID=316 RepID=UPI00210EC828|nr:SdiA-regulated domain-containing protein [Stutzerimonas stutzeri]MCQ4319843.1 SdiA-regulated domain-containing protein [Stutzerimonas stutzeri]
MTTITDTRRWWLRGARPQAWALAMLAAGLLYAGTTFHLDERVFYSLQSAWHEDSRQAHSLWLPEYQVRVEAKPVATVGNNLSGLTFDEQRNQLWAVVNNPEELVALDLDGELIARYPLKGFVDVEGITYLGDNLLAVVEERSQSIVILPVPSQPSELVREDYAAVSLSMDASDNSGFEGLGYDRAGDRLFAVKEHSPRRLYEIQGIKASLNGQLNLNIIDREAWIEDKDMASDLASVHYDERTGHLVLLSDEAKMLLELDSEGELVSFSSLWRGSAGLDNSVPQAEGMTFDARGDLYVVSEPNLFYAFERKSRTADQPRRIIQTPAKISSSPPSLPRLIDD